MSDSKKEVIMKAKFRKCTACGKKDLLIGKTAKNLCEHNVDTGCLNLLGVEAPKRGWHWFDSPSVGKAVKVYPVCEKCYEKVKKIRIGKTK